MLKRQLGEIIRREIPLGKAGMLNVNQVDVSSDLHSAIVFIGIVGTAEQKKRGMTLLHKERGRIQNLLGRAIVLKYTPQLRFIHDESVPRGNRVLEILEELESSTPTNEEPSKDH
jgi:ribosome-binding factor A